MLGAPNARAGDGAESDRIYTIIHRADGTEQRSSEKLVRPESLPLRGSFPPKEGTPTVEVPALILDPQLEALLQPGNIAARNSQIRVIVRFREVEALSPLPSLDSSEPLDSVRNLQVRSAIEAHVEQLTARRRTAIEAALARILGPAAARTHLLEAYWLFNGGLVELPTAQLQRLSLDPEVERISAETSPTGPADSSAANDVDDGRFVIRSDPYLSLGGGTVGFAGLIGVLDTGLRASHVLFNQPSNIRFKRDCVLGGVGCVGGPQNTEDDCWNHGTALAGIVTANSRLGAQYRGVTQIPVDVWKIFPSSFSGNNCVGFLNRNAAVRGFQAAAAAGDKTIVIATQDTEGSAGQISAAADAAYDAGIAVVAANGNSGPTSSTVGDPASAHRVLGIGSVDIVTLATETTQSRGPASDGRIKPDIQAPTNTETASTGCIPAIRCTQSNTALLPINGTSGAVPYAGAAAAIARNYLGLSGASIEPGHVYAYLILSGARWPTHFTDNTRGAGLISLPTPTSGIIKFGKVRFTGGTQLDIPITINQSGLSTFDAAIWWPERQFLNHNDIDLFIQDFNGLSGGFSQSIDSVFERARDRGVLLAPGTWRLRLLGATPAGPQDVYWAAWVH